MVTPLLAAETAPWGGADGRMRFGVHPAGVHDLFTAAAALLRANDPDWAARRNTLRASVAQACWRDCLRLYLPGAEVQTAIDALVADHPLPDWTGPKSASADELVRAQALARWATIHAAAALADERQA